MPQKVAAMEGNWETGPNIPLLLFALPDQETRSNSFEIGIPSGASIILRHDPNGIVPGLNDFVAEDGTPLHPRVEPVFWAFRVMVGIGLVMLVVSWGTAYLLWRRRGDVDALPRWLLVGFVPMAASGWVATLAGWYTTEIGRQPWLVHGVLMTREAVAELDAAMVWSTLAMYLAVYAFLLLAYIRAVFYLAGKAAEGKPPVPIIPSSEAAAAYVLSGKATAGDTGR